MPLEGLLVIAHIVGAAMGVGSATASDSIFLRSIRNRRISSEQFVLIRSVSDVVLGGMALVSLTGVGLLLLNPELIDQAKFQVKMLAVVAILGNGLVFHVWIFPWLNRHRDSFMGQESLNAGRRWLFAGARHGVSCAGYLTAFLRPDPAVKRGTRLAAICIVSPVRGLRPSRAPREATWNLPKPVNETSSPERSASSIDFSTASTALLASFFERPLLSATRSTKSDFVMAPPSSLVGVVVARS
jgi:hypothetical protein